MQKVVMKKIVMQLKLLIALCVFVSLSHAGQVAKGHIDEMVNQVNNNKNFGVKMSATSTGPCAGQWVWFNEANFSGNLESYKFAFSLAATALVSDKEVRIHNYTNDACDGVTFIGLYK